MIYKSGDYRSRWVYLRPGQFKIPGSEEYLLSEDPALAYVTEKLQVSATNKLSWYFTSCYLVQHNTFTRVDAKKAPYVDPTRWQKVLLWFKKAPSAPRAEVVSEV